MKNKIQKKINKLLIILFAIVFILSPIFSSAYKNNSINNYIFIFSIINILGLINYIVKPYKIDKKILYYLIFILTYFFPLVYKEEIIYLKEHYQIIILVFLLLGVSINASNIFKEKKDLLNKIIIYSTTITSLISIIYNFNPQIFQNIGICGNYSDYYITSVYRLYGTFQYPNTLGLYSLIGIILSLKYYKNNLIFKIIIYINSLTLLLTMSKTVLLFAIIIFTIFIIIDKKTIRLLFSMILPLLINTNNYRNAILNNNMISYIFITLISIVVFIIIYKCWKNKISINIIILILIIGILLPPKPLQIKSNNNKLLITEFIELNGKYQIELNIKGDNLKGNIYLYKHYLQNESMAYKIEKKVPLNKNIKFSFETQENIQYYSLQVENFGTPISIENVILKDENNNQNIGLDYYIFPYNYIQSFKQTKYDIGSVSSRFEIYKFSTNLIKQKPLTGHGFDYFKTQTINSENIKKVLVEHSQIMTIGVQNGIFGIIFWCSLIWMIIINCIRGISKQNIYNVLIIFLLIYSSLYDFSMSYHYLLLLLFIYSMIILNDNKKDIMYICSTGGHLSAMNQIIKNINNNNTILITEKSKISNIENVKYVLNGSRGEPLKYMLILPINIILNIIYFIHYNPKIIITTGAHTGLFMCYLGKLFGKKIIFIEVYDRFKKLTLSGKMSYKIVDYFIVQHETLLEKYPKAKYIGEIY